MSADVQSMGGDLRSEMLRGMLWKEWRAHSSVIIRWTLMPVFAVTVLQVLHRPYLVGLASVLAAICLTRRIVGGDVWEGAEEFSFALPPTKRMIFWTRYLMCAVPFFAVLAWNLACIQWNIPQILWGLFVESGFTHPFPFATGNEYLLSLFIPIAVFHFSFAGCTVNANRNGLSAMWLVSPGVAALLALCGAIVDSWLFPVTRTATGAIGVFDWPFYPLLTLAMPLLLSFVAFFVIARLFLFKEAYSGDIPGQSIRVWVIVVGIIALLVVFYLLVMVMYISDAPRPVESPETISIEEIRDMDSEISPSDAEDGPDTEGGE